LKKDLLLAQLTLVSDNNFQLELIYGIMLNWEQKYLEKEIRKYGKWNPIVGQEQHRLPEENNIFMVCLEKLQMI
jgi:hypothetical protein